MLSHLLLQIQFPIMEDVRRDENYKEDTEPINITWASYHADISIKGSQPLAITAMLPLFRHSANSLTVI